MIFPFVMTSFAHAQDAVEGASTTTLVVQPPVQKRWSLPLVLEYASSFHKESAYEHQAQESLTLAPSYKISDQWSAGLLTSIYKDESNGEEGGITTWDNTRVSLSGTSPLLSNLDSNFGVAGVLATHQALRDQSSYQGGMRLSVGGLWKELFHGSALRYGLAFTRNFHEFSINAQGAFNVRENLANSLEFSLPFNESLSIVTSFIYTAGYTYRDDLRTKFVTEANLVWQVNKTFSLATGASNEGNALGPNGRDSNIEFFNDNSSLFKLGLTYIL